MSRPAEFDYEQVLNRAMLVFWTQGYAGTSIQDLVEKTDLLRGSIYNTFGDKHTLYIETLKKYSSLTIHQIESIIATDEPIRERVRNILMVIVNMSDIEKQRGSMICNCIIEALPNDVDAAKVVIEASGMVQDTMEKYLTIAQQTNQTSKAANPKALARYLASSIHGLCVTAKGGASRDELLEIVDLTLLPFT